MTSPYYNATERWVQPGYVTVVLNGCVVDNVCTSWNGGEFFFFVVSMVSRVNVSIMIRVRLGMLVVSE